LDSEQRTADSEQRTANSAQGTAKILGSRGSRREFPCSPFAVRRSLTRASGFTIAELITVVAIIAILAAVAMPVASFGFRRQREIELHERLRKITDAIDRYHDHRVSGTVKRIKDAEAVGANGYPKKLDELVDGFELLDGSKVKLLRARDLIDPMTGKNEWNTKSNTDDPDSVSTNGDNVFEIHSTSTALALDGKTHYNEW
jgi:general secretion pathway protein G